MTQPDLNNLRALLDEYERYANSVAGSGCRTSIAHRMLEIVADARAGLRPSLDGTANYLESKSIVQRLDCLRKEAEALS